ncbi:CBP80/20-dependent translation initiation factor isoform X1 [Marmota marmota marmota]|uniref:CBP80/20-dependent translation initiation factor isoform X1 n=1 Tax=Marmota marmota marmota TaxID=9994 RepID=UPI00209278FD|nr:CBP80/20-dependent translation initiation factor isoform X1 [Marmota marmota marmota]XP_048662209.1 CBP80/20-dependent translation initiation factor isoform X1 [Marmota marmota marmota]XP_048662210.1 CBP80/20-dependent translation initiation factor isoform X1 [Marmota marmota marmota]
MENSSAASASSEAGSSRSQEIEELERFIDSYVLEYQVQGLLTDKTEGDTESQRTQSHISQEEALNGGPPMKGLTEEWTADCSEQLNSSCSFSRGRAPPQQNGSKDSTLDMLGTDIWAANTFDSFSGATWDLQPEKLDFTQFHRKVRHTPKQPLPHIDREGCGKGKLEDGDGINLNDIEKVLPTWQGYHPMPHEVEIAHTKKLFRRRRNDRRRQQRPPAGNKPQQHGDHQPGSAKHNRDHQKSYQGGSAASASGRPNHHGYSQNRRWYQSSMKHPPGDKGEAGAHRNAKETVAIESPKLEDTPGNTRNSGLETPRSPDTLTPTAPERLPPQPPGGPEAETKHKDSVPPERAGERPRITLLQSSKDRLRRRLKEKVPDEVAVETTSPQQNKMDKLIEILNSMRNNSSDVDTKLTTFMEEAQNSTNSEEMLGEIVRTIYQKAVSDRSFAFTAAKLCDKMALFMVEGTKFRSLLLNMLQKDFTVREELQQQDVERWLGFITFLCEVFGTMRSSTGEPFRVLVCPIYTCLRELLQSQDVKEDAVLCCSMELQSTGRLLEEQLPEMMTELLASARDKMLCPSESMLTRSLLLEVIELHANSWNPLTPPITQYYNRTIQKLTA